MEYIQLFPLFLYYFGFELLKLMYGTVQKHNYIVSFTAIDLGAFVIKKVGCMQKNKHLIFSPQIRSSDSNDWSIGDVGKPLDDESGSSHFSQPVVIRSLGPVFGVILASDGEGADFVAFAMKVLKLVTYLNFES